MSCSGKVDKQFIEQRRFPPGLLLLALRDGRARGLAALLASPTIVMPAVDNPGVAGCDLRWSDWVRLTGKPVNSIGQQSVFFEAASKRLPASS